MRQEEPKRSNQINTCFPHGASSLLLEQELNFRVNYQPGDKKEVKASSLFDAHTVLGSREQRESKDPTALLEHQQV